MFAATEDDKTRWINAIKEALYAHSFYRIIIRLHLSCSSGYLIGIDFLSLAPIYNPKRVEARNMFCR